MIEILWTYQGNTEVVDTCEEKDVAYLLREYRLAFNGQGTFRTRKARGEAA